MQTSSDSHNSATRSSDLTAAGKSKAGDTRTLAELGEDIPRRMVQLESYMGQFITLSINNKKTHHTAFHEPVDHVITKELKKY